MNGRPATAAVALTLCAGRPEGLHPDAGVCPRRGDCARYRGLLAFNGQPVPITVPVATGLCRDGQDWHVVGSA